MIPYGKQQIDQSDVDAVLEVLHSDFLTQGPTVEVFEQELAKRCDANFAVAVNSATSALHLACLALDVGPGDLVWTSAVTFVASANCARYCGASVDFVDIDPITNNMSTEALHQKLKSAAKTGRLPKVVIPVHLTGQSCDMEAIWKLSQQFGFRIIEDASHAVGARYCGRPVGDCFFSDICVFSFHPVKIITTAEGGVATTKAPDLATKLRLLRSHGVTRDEALMKGQSEGPWYYEQLCLGFNYRMTDLHAALGITQLRRMDDFIRKRHLIADKYDDLLADLPLTLPVRVDNCYSSLHLYVVRITGSSVGSHRKIFEAMQRQGVGVPLPYRPGYRHPSARDLGFYTE